MTKIPIFYTYETVDKPWGGANNFLKSLYSELSKYKNFELTPFRDDQSYMKILFLNQLSRGPLNKSLTFNRKEIKLLRSNCKFLIVRAVNLFSNSSYKISLKNPFLYLKQDNLSIYLTNIADHVIFQSEFQKNLFKKKGYVEKKSSVIHNGSSIFKNIKDRDLERIFSNDPKKKLIITSSSFSNRKNKNHDLIAKISLLPNVSVNHYGSWPNNLEHFNVNLHGIIPHNDLCTKILNSHYFLHPAINDPCPNSIIEALSLGIPVIYNPEIGSSSEIVRNNGIALDVDNLQSTLNKAQNEHYKIANNANLQKNHYSISNAAKKYQSVFNSYI